jgi:diguanylate cyclase (GGDEF)-like protein
MLVTGSIGIAIYPEDGLDQQTLFKNADKAMYEAKQGGRNRYCFFSELN